MKDTLSFLVDSLLKQNKISIDSQELDFQIKSHPSYPSLHAVTGVLTHFNIDNAAIQVPVEKAILEQLPNCFLAQIKTDKGDDFAVVTKNKDSFKLIFNSKEKKTINQDTFFKKFTGIIVAVEKDESILLEKTNNRSIIKSLTILAIIAFIGLILVSNFNLFSFSYLILSGIGLFFSSLIVQHDLGINSKLVDSICSLESKTTNCNAVLNSKGATLFKNFKLSDISIIYFSTSCFSVLLLTMAKNTLSPLFFISVFAIPVIIYSVYYQIAVAKTWCALCLGIVSVLVIQSLFYFLEKGFSLENFSLESINILVFSFITTCALWLYTSKKLKNENELKEIKINAFKFKRNFELFNTVLEQSEILDYTQISAQEIVLGNRNAPVNLTVITNPYCGYCKNVHALVENILKKYHEDVSILIRFNVNPTDPESDIVKITTRIIEIYNTKGELDCLKAMHSIYNGASASQWFNTWSNCTDKTTYNTVLKKGYDWCAKNGINFTPELLINGKSYPKAYDKTDLIYFIEELNEAYASSKNTTYLETTI